MRVTYVNNMDRGVTTTPVLNYVYLDSFSPDFPPKKEHDAEEISFCMPSDFEYNPYYQLLISKFVDKRLVGETPSDEDILLEIEEHDTIIRMSPINEYRVHLKIGNIQNAVPQVVSPEDI